MDVDRETVWYYLVLLWIFMIFVVVFCPDAGYYLSLGGLFCSAAFFGTGGPM